MSELALTPAAGRGLPTVDAAAVMQQRREAAKQATARRLERERKLAERMAEWLGSDLVVHERFRDQHSLTVKLPRVHAALQHARDQLGFAQLTDVTAVDTLKLEGAHPERFWVVWTLTNLEQEARLRLKAYVDEDHPVVPTASDLWPSANWAEREVWDMFGIEFSGHPNLIRLLMPAEYSGHPLRKDYPLRGRGERDNFPVIPRVERES